MFREGEMRESKTMHRIHTTIDRRLNLMTSIVTFDSDLTSTVAAAAVHASNWNSQSHMANSIRFRIHFSSVLHSTFIIFYYFLPAAIRLAFVLPFDSEPKSSTNKQNDTQCTVIKIIDRLLSVAWLTMITYAVCWLADVGVFCHIGQMFCFFPKFKVVIDYPKKFCPHICFGHCVRLSITWR